MAHVLSDRPYYVDLLARARREPRRLSLVEHDIEAVWVPVEWIADWKRGQR